MAIDRMLASRPSCGTTASTSSALRGVNCRNASTRARVGGTTGNPSVHSWRWKCSWISSNVPLNATAPAAGSAAEAASRGCSPVNPRSNPGASDSSTLRRRTSSLSTIGAPGYTPIASGTPSPLVTTSACFRNPDPMMDAVGIPSRSTIAAARNTAGVQAPHAPMPTITASAWCAFSLSGICALTFASSAPWKLPNSS